MLGQFPLLLLLFFPNFRLSGDTAAAVETKMMEAVAIAIQVFIIIFMIDDEYWYVLL